MDKARLLESDLDSLAGIRRLVSPDIRAAIGKAEERIATSDGAALLGQLYVMEGSALGGLMLAPRMKAALGLEPNQMRYYGADGRQTVLAFRAFGSRMNEAICGQEAIDRAVSGAESMFAAVAEIFDAIWEVSSTARHSASASASAAKQESQQPQANR